MSGAELSEIEEATGFELHADVRIWFGFSRNLGFRDFPCSFLSPLGIQEAMDLRFEVDAEAIEVYSLRRFAFDQRSDLRAMSEQHLPALLFPVMADENERAPLSVESHERSAGAVFVSGLGGAGWVAESMGHIFRRVRRLHQDGLIVVTERGFQSRVAEMADLRHLEALPVAERDAVVALIENGRIGIEEATEEALAAEFAWTYDRPGDPTPPQ